MKVKVTITATREYEIDEKEYVKAFELGEEAEASDITDCEAESVRDNLDDFLAGVDNVDVEVVEVPA